LRKGVYIYIYIYMAVSHLFVAPDQALRKHPPSVSTKHSIGHVLLSSRCDLAPFSFNQTFHRAQFVVIQTRSGPIQFQPSMESDTFCSHPDPIWPRSVSTKHDVGPFKSSVVPTVVRVQSVCGRFGSDRCRLAGEWAPTVSRWRAVWLRL
jgi:hypothetical protein